MRHRSKGRKFGRKSAPRNAMKRDIVNALFRHGRITTTLPRAKEFRIFAERVITVAKRGAAAAAAGDKVRALNANRKLIAELHDETIAAKLMSEIGPSFADRPGGYTRVIKLVKVRKGDAAPTALLELVNYEPPASAEGEPAAEAKQPAKAEEKTAAKPDEKRPAKTAGKKSAKETAPAK